MLSFVLSLCRQTDGRTDGQTDNGETICPRSFDMGGIKMIGSKPRPAYSVKENIISTTFDLSSGNDLYLCKTKLFSS